MKLIDLKNRIDGYYERVHESQRERLDNTEVVVILKERSVGPRAHIKVGSATKGFDWESGMFCIVTEEPVVRHKSNEKV